MSEQVRSEHWKQWYGQNEAENRQVGSAAKGVPAKRVRHRQWIEVAKHEWLELGLDAKPHGLSRGKFLMLLWRNWRLTRPSLSVVPEIPGESYKRAG